MTETDLLLMCHTVMITNTIDTLNIVKTAIQRGDDPKKVIDDAISGLEIMIASIESAETGKLN